MHFGPKIPGIHRFNSKKFMIGTTSSLRALISTGGLYAPKTLMWSSGFGSESMTSTKGYCLKYKGFLLRRLLPDRYRSSRVHDTKFFHLGYLHEYSAPLDTDCTTGCCKPSTRHNAKRQSAADRLLLAASSLSTTLRSRLSVWSEEIKPGPKKKNGTREVGHIRNQDKFVMDCSISSAVWP